MSAGAQPDIAGVAAAIGQPARAAMLDALLGDEPLAVQALAARAGVSASTASLHLGRLADAGLVTGRRHGRVNRYELAGPGVAAALEALQRISPPRPVRSLSAATNSEQLRFARSCYDHLAGRVGVAVTDALVDRDHLRQSTAQFALTEQGERWMESLDVDVPALHRSRRRFALACLDWSERRPHVAGAVGAALLSQFLARGWFERRRGRRTLHPTPAGSAALQSHLGIDLDRL